MKAFIIISVIALVSTASGRTVAEEESVVSVYTTQSTTAGTGPAPAPTPAYDVYQQIANNIAQRITSPIYRFLGLNQSSTVTTTKQPPLKIELLEDPPHDVTKSIQPVDNNIDKVDKVRDVEELSLEASRRSDTKKPEKITLYSSYLPPVTGKLQRNDSINEVNDEDDDDDFTFDEFEKEEPPKPRSNPFIYILEWLASAAQIAYGIFEALFRPKTN